MSTCSEISEISRLGLFIAVNFTPLTVHLYLRLPQNVVRMLVEEGVTADER